MCLSDLSVLRSTISLKRYHYILSYAGLQYLLPAILQYLDKYILFFINKIVIKE